MTTPTTITTYRVRTPVRDSFNEFLTLEAAKVYRDQQDASTNAEEPSPIETVTKPRSLTWEEEQELLNPSV